MFVQPNKQLLKTKCYSGMTTCLYERHKHLSVLIQVTYNDDSRWAYCTVCIEEIKHKLGNLIGKIEPLYFKFPFNEYTV